MSIKAYITSESRECVLDSSFSVINLGFDLGFTFVDNDAILNNGISLSCTEVPDGAIISIDPYGRIIGKIVDMGVLQDKTVKPKVKLALNKNGTLYEDDFPLGAIVSAAPGFYSEFTEIQDVGGGEGGGGVVS